MYILYILAVGLTQNILYKKSKFQHTESNMINLKKINERRTQTNTLVTVIISHFTQVVRNEH